MNKKQWKASFKDILSQSLVICEIMTFLDLNSLKNLSLCNKRLSKLFKNERVWHQRLKNHKFECLILDDLKKERMRGKTFERIKTYLKIKKEVEGEKAEKSIEEMIPLYLILSYNQEEREVVWNKLKKNLPIYQLRSSFYFKAIKEEKIFRFEIVDFNLEPNKKLPVVMNKGYKSYLNSSIFSFKFYDFSKDALQLNYQLFHNQKYLLLIDQKMQENLIHSPLTQNHQCYSFSSLTPPSNQRDEEDEKREEDEIGEEEEGEEGGSEKLIFEEEKERVKREEKIELIEQKLERGEKKKGKRGRVSKEEEIEKDWMMLPFNNQFQFVHPEVESFLEDGRYVAEIDARDSSFKKCFSLFLNQTIQYHLCISKKYSVIQDVRAEHLSESRRNRSLLIFFFLYIFLLTKKKKKEFGD